MKLLLAVFLCLLAVSCGYRTTGRATSTSVIQVQVRDGDSIRWKCLNIGNHLFYVWEPKAGVCYEKKSGKVDR